MPSKWCAVFLTGLLWTHGLAHAQASVHDPAGVTAPAQAPAAAETGQPGLPEPRTGDFDWVRLKNGEWLKGEIEELQDDSFTFESDELDTVSLDWDDVAEVHSNRPATIMLLGRETVEGSTLTVDQQQVRMMTADGEQTFDREQLRVIIPGRATERNYWSGKLSLGFTGRSGNVDQVDIAAYAYVQRRDAYSRLYLDYNGAYSEVEGEKTADNHRATLNYDIYLTPRFYIRPVGIIFYRDPFQNVEYRITPGAGVGYDVIDEKRLEWTVNGGIGYQYTKFTDTPGVVASDDGTAVLLFGSSVEWEATKTIDVGSDFQIAIPVPETIGYNFRLVLWTEIDIYGDLDLDIRFTWDRFNDPPPSSDGTTPQPDDYRLYIGIGWEF